KDLWSCMVRADNGVAGVLLCAVFTVAVLGVLSLIELMFGGAVRELIVARDGVTILRRWRSRRIQSSDILGARHTHFAAANGKRTVSNVLLVCRGRGRSILLRENGFRVGRPGVLAGALLHRYGEYLPPNTSRPPAV